ncbi:DNA-binding transcriptional regulator YbjK [Kibdelosporangium sp. 4NS15]|uniref:DNA-binding transcriptional regulator YbjK n=1 Tax=Kibdelosporangium persicum TaxID=2698649 RepID=A0ABX2F0U7_9PSEU|nr:DNA-binding transcriptional regulator YbjK [Kibdelosporangium persicum]
MQYYSLVPTRRNEILIGAVSVLARGGPRALTHLSVDAAAELPKGSTSNHFRTRDALIQGVLGHLVKTEQSLLADLLGKVEGVVDREAFVRKLTDMVLYMTEPARELTLARRAIFLEAAWRPEIADQILGWTVRYWQLGGRWLDRLGSPDPEGHARILLACLDGLITEVLTRPLPALDIQRACRIIVAGLLDESV